MRRSARHRRITRLPELRAQRICRGDRRRTRDRSEEPTPCSQRLMMLKMSSPMTQLFSQRLGSASRLCWVDDGFDLAVESKRLPIPVVRPARCEPTSSSRRACAATRLMAFRHELICSAQTCARPCAIFAVCSEFTLKDCVATIWRLCVVLFRAHNTRIYSIHT